jgi:hypothetical protein
MISEADKRRFHEDGYLLVEGVVPESLCAAVRSTICEFLHMHADDPRTWPARQRRGHGIVPVHHAQALWDVRQHPAVHGVFAALHGTDRLWVIYDRVSFKAPDPAAELEPAEPVHWDRHPADSGRLSIQGLIYLTDTAADGGAFCCVPDLYRGLDRYLAEHPDHGDSRRPTFDPSSIVTVPGPAGSLLVWNRGLPHSSMTNVGARPRWVQYVAMDPVADEAARQRRVAEFEERLPPDWAVVQNVAGQQIPEPGPTARLTVLGRRLVGLEPWPPDPAPTARRAS